MDTYTNKIDAVKFAAFIAYIQRIDTSSLDEYLIRDIMSYIVDLIPPADQIAKQSCAQEVRDMFSYMANGDKINAIRSYRSLTGDGLKECKDAVENALSQKFAQKPYDPDKGLSNYRDTVPTIHYEDDGTPVDPITRNW